MTASTGTSTPPSEFICPITMELMVHPVRVNGGRSSGSGGLCFERWAILEWIYFGNDGKGGTHPLSRQPLHPEDLRNDLSLKRDIEAWRKQQDVPTPAHPYDLDNQEDDEEEDEVKALEAAFEIATDARWNKRASGIVKNEPLLLDRMPPHLLNIRNRVLQSRATMICQHRSI